MILWLARLTGISSLSIWAFVGLATFGLFFGYGEVRYHTGKTFGAAQERIAWEEARKREIAKRVEQQRQAQEKIDHLEQDYLDQKARADSAMAELEAEISKASPNPVFPKSLAESLDRIGR